MPFQRVRWSPSHPSHLEPVPEPSAGDDMYPPFHVVRLALEFEQHGDFLEQGDTIERIWLETVQEPGISPSQKTTLCTLERREFDSLSSLLSAFQAAFDRIDPDIVLTAGGDQRWFPWLVEQTKAHHLPLVLGRTSEPLRQSTGQSTIHS